ncbi:9198_t:CDS:2, partial [Paraglomus brasilianum]
QPACTQKSPLVRYTQSRDRWYFIDSRHPFLFDSMDFYKSRAVEDWTCKNLVEFYRITSGQKDRKKLLDSINKDLKKVKEASSEFDPTRKRKAQRIIDNWKDWTMMGDDTGFKFEFHQVQQQVLATGHTVSIDNIDNRRLTGKHHRDDGEEIADEADVTPPKKTKKAKTSDNWKDNDAAAIDAEEISDSDDADAEPNNTEIENLNQEVNNLNDTEVSIRNILLDVLNQRKSRDLESEKTFMNSTFLNGIIDLTDPDMRRQIKSTLHEEQQSWLDQSFVKGRFDPFFDEGHDIAQDIMKHFSLRLEAPSNIESKALDLERTFAIDTIVYIVNRLFKMHQDEVDLVWIEILTPNTSKCKIDGVMKALLTKQTHQTLVLFEFSFGRKAPMSKDYEDR